MYSPKELLQPIRNSLKLVLRPLDFRVRGNTFYRDRERIRHLIQIQSSRSSEKGNLRLTLNLGVMCSEILASWDSEYSIWSAHWHKRAGSLAFGEDIWWTVSNLDESEIIARESVGMIHDLVIPKLDEFSSLQKLIEVAERDGLPGQTELQSIQTIKKLKSLIKD